MARYVAIESNTMCGDHDHWWQVRDTWDRQTLLGYYYEAGARKMAAALNTDSRLNVIDESVDGSGIASEYGLSGLFDGKQ